MTHNCFCWRLKVLSLVLCDEMKSELRRLGYHKLGMHVLLTVIKLLLALLILLLITALANMWTSGRVNSKRIEKPTEWFNSNFLDEYFMLNYFLLSSNNLIGAVPATLGKSMPLLRILYMNSNQLTGGVGFIASLLHRRDFDWTSTFG